MDVSKYLKMLQSDEVEMKPTNEITDFYKGANIFITGGTGFLGKLLIEKLLRTCPDIRNIYMLIRTKKGKDMQTRLADMLDDVVFKRMTEANAENPKKIIGLIGDVGALNLGLAEVDWKLITDNVDIIFHVAATVNFEAPMTNAVNINVRGTKIMLELAKSCKNLRSFIHVSTAYSNCVLSCIEERLYDQGMDSEGLIKLINDNDVETIRKMTPTLLGKFPNTYCYTKCAAEQVIEIDKEDLPLCIFRPGIVIATYEEPVRSWIDNFYGPTGLATGVGYGIIHTILHAPNAVVDFVPGDLVANAMITTCYETARLHEKGLNSDSAVKVYNYVASPQNTLTCADWMALNTKYSLNFPSINCFWYYYVILTSNTYLHFCYKILFHYIPALILDGLAILTGKKPQLLGLYLNINKFGSVLQYFTSQTWEFKIDNITYLWQSISEDAQIMFPFSMAEINWDKYCKTHLLGLRTFLVKEPLETLPAARIKWQRLKILHNVCKYGLLLLAIRLACYIGSFVYSIIF